MLVQVTHGKWPSPRDLDPPQKDAEAEIAQMLLVAGAEMWTEGPHLEPLRTVLTRGYTRLFGIFLAWTEDEVVKRGLDTTLLRGLPQRKIGKVAALFIAAGAPPEKVGPLNRAELAMVDERLRALRGKVRRAATAVWWWATDAWYRPGGRGFEVARDNFALGRASFERPTVAQASSAR